MPSRVLTQKPNIQRTNSVRSPAISVRSSAKRCSKLRLEPRIVELVQFAEIGSVGQVHGVEPVDQLIGYILAQTRRTSAWTAWRSPARNCSRAESVTA